jgi:hypothetical protein
MGKAVHIWTKRAVVDIPEGVERPGEYNPNVWCLADKRAAGATVTGDLWLVELVG